jgi:ornithine carbamoyltransferase
VSSIVISENQQEAIMNGKEKTELCVKKTLDELIHPTFQSISDYLLSRKIQHQCSRGIKRHVLAFTGKNGKACEFSIIVEMIRRDEDNATWFPGLVINHKKGNQTDSNNIHIPAEQLTPDNDLPPS